MKLTREQALSKIKSTALGARHKDYVRTVELALSYKRFNTGQGIEELLSRYHPRETEEEFAQRKLLTRSITSTFVSSIKKPFQKVPSTDRVTRRIIPKNKTKDKKIEAEIQQKLDLFYGSDSEEGGLDYWLRTRFLDLSFSDPNAFIVIEFENFDNKTETPNAYPFEVPSEKVLNFEFDNNNIQWLAIYDDIKYVESFKAKKPDYMNGKKYTIYCGDFSITMTRVSSNADVRMMYAKDDEEIIELSTREFYSVRFFETKLPDWQFFRVGYVSDEVTNDRTMVNPYHSAIPYFEKSVKAVSEMDLTNILHAFPQKYAYVTPCQGEKDLGCNKGQTRAGGTCGACGGSGASVHKSAQNVATFALPDNKEDLFPLRDMMAYFTPPIELLDFQYKLVNDFEPKIHQCVFNSTVLVQKTIVATATEKDQDMDSVYDTLMPFARKCSAVYLNVCNAIATLLDLGDRVSFVYRYPTDFKIKTKQMLLNEYKTVGETSAPSFVREAIQDDLAYQVFIDDPEGLIKYKVKKRFMPFRGKSDEQTILSLNSQYTSTKSKILFLNFEEIFSEAEVLNANFYILDYTAQKEIIDKIIEGVKEHLPSFEVGSAFNPLKIDVEEEN